MPQIATPWTAGQIALSLVLIVSCVLLRRARPTPAGPPGLSPRIARRVFQAAMGFAAVVLIARGDAPVGVRPDSWTDACVVVAGRNYAREGLRARAAAPQHQVITDRHPSDPFFIYTRHPIGANLVNGALQCIGLASDRLMRLPPFLCSLLGLWFWLLIFRRHVDEATACLAAATLATSYGFLAYADLLYFHAYAFAAVAGAVYCFVRGAGGVGRPVRGWLVGAAVCMFAGACFTWEYHLWLLVFLLSYSLLVAHRIRRRTLLLLALPLFVASALHAAYRGAVADAVGLVESPGAGVKSTIFYNIYLRTIGFAESVDTPEGLTLAGYPLHLAVRIYFFYGIPIVGLVALLWLALARPREADAGSPGPDLRPPVGEPPAGLDRRLLIALLLAGGAWWCVMMQHSSVHMQVMRHALPAYALLMGMVLAGCLRRIHDPTDRLPARAAAMLLAATLLFIQGEGLLCNLRMHFDDTFVDPRGRDDVGLLERSEFLRLDRMVPANAVLLTNSNRHAPMRLWSRRPVYETVYRTARAAKPKRAGFELAYNHLRDLHRKGLPPLYYVFCTRDGYWQQAVRESTHLRFLLLGNAAAAPDAAWSAADLILREAIEKGRSDQSACPIVGISDRFACFDLAPALPMLTKQFEPMGYPTLQEFEGTE